MTNTNYKKAFTLIELLTVVLIIGLIASVALVTVKDTNEVKAKQYTKKVIQSVKEGIANKDGDYFTGFMNDFGTMPPNTLFLLNELDEYKFVGGELIRLKIKSFRDFNKTKNRIIAMPFMDNEVVAGEDYNDTNLNINNMDDFKTSTMYTGFHGGYIGEAVDSDSNKSLKDGWNSILNITVDLNISDDNPNSFLLVQSGGSDGMIAPTDNDRYIKPEFDEYANDDSIKGFYADDINISFRKQNFIPRGLTTDVTDSRRVIIYSPMLYYVEDSEGVECDDKTTTHAHCDGTDKVYKPYDHSSKNIDSNNTLNWQIGVIKYEIKTDDNVIYQIFVNDVIEVNRTKQFIDFDDDFYISAGEKEIVIIDDNNFTTSFSKVFLPNREIDITYP